VFTWQTSVKGKRYRLRWSFSSSRRSRSRSTAARRAVSTPLLDVETIDPLHDDLGDHPGRADRGANASPSSKSSWTTSRTRVPPLTAIRFRSRSLQHEAAVFVEGHERLVGPVA
jgi:hypothetical protein